MKAVFSDFDEFADSIQGIAGRFVPTARPEADWWLSVEPVGGLSLQQLQIGGAATYAGDGTPDTLTFGIPMTHPGRIRIDGQPLDDNSFIFLKRDQPFTFAARETTRWAGITIRFDHESMRPLLYEAACDRAEQGSTRARSDLRHLNQLRAFAARICAVDGSVTFLDPAAERAAEQEILTCAACALESESEELSNNLGRPSYNRERVIARSLEVINANEGKALFIDDLCRAAEVSERTLRNIFQEYFDVGPMRLLKLRQLVEIRTALLAADSRADLVTQIAARFGIWDFSLFARNYKALFGETPSTTLRTAASASVLRQETAWIRCAAKKFLGTDMLST
jgi:AraC family ethanolamine operon transcriptional activator